MTKKRSEIDPGALPLVELVPKIARALASLEDGERLYLAVPDPDPHPGLPSGSLVTIGGRPGRVRSYRSWFDLADGLDCRVGTPEKTGDGLVRIPLSPLDKSVNWHEAPAPDDPTEKYGVDSPYAALDKLEEPGFALDLVHAIRLSRKGRGARALILGVNDGREIPAFGAALGEDVFSSMTIVGVDHCRSAIERAKAAYPSSAFTFLREDIGDLDPARLGRFDLILSIGTLQSRSLDLKPTFMRLFQEFLERDGSVVLGFPNCRHIDNELVYGAVVRNWPDSDMANLVNDVHFCKRYLQQHKRAVRIFGKYYVFMVGYRVP